MKIQISRSQSGISLLTLTIVSATMAWSQGGSSQTPQAQQVQLSGRAQGGGSVTAQQTASGSTSSSVNTVNTTITV